MKFSEVYKIYKEPIYRGGTVETRIPKLICNISQTDILRQLHEIEDSTRLTPDYKKFQNGDLYHYLNFMDSFGDVTLNNGLVSFVTYKQMYSKNWEYKWRTRHVENLQPNTALCKAMNVPDRYFGKHFGNIENYPEQAELIGRAKNFGEKRKFKGSMLLGSGYKPTSTSPAIRGIGKTMAVVCSMMEYYKRYDLKDQWTKVPKMGKSILMIKEYELYMLIRSTYAVNTPFYENDIIERLCGVDYLFYDDLFAVSDNDFIKRIAYIIVDRRVDCLDKATVFTTAYDQNAMQRNFADIYDRLSRGIIYYDKNIKKSYRK